MLEQLIENINNLLYTYILIVLLIGIGLFFTFKTNCVQITLFKDALKELMHKNEGTHGISSFQSLMISTASRVGTGNIAGVAVAISIGGPGSVFWMWVIAIIGSASAFIESTLAQVYKERDGKEFRGGPAYYIKRGIGSKPMAILFAVLLISCFAFGFNGLQSFNVASSISYFFPDKSVAIVVGIIIALLAGLIFFGGTKRIGFISSIIVPIMAVIYIAMGLIVIFNNIGELPNVLGDIFSQALGYKAIVGGTIGGAILQGIKRGLFSNEAGMGSSPNAAATANVSHPVKQGLVQVVSVFIDTLIICTTTAVFLLLANTDPNAEGIALVQSAFVSEFGQAGNIFITVAIILFAFTSIIGNYSYAESNFKFITTNKIALNVFRLLCLLPICLGAVSNMSLAWNTADILMGLMALLNIIAIFQLRNVAFKCLKDYKQQKVAGKDPIFNPESLEIDNTAVWQKESTQKN